ncbi:hypothetical protein VTN00DRAFT_4052 [Thermoascus crustaceus]|uniref:uncharacterized protein n=1 Tax=Thermoascus crustaceus TaxID=5088 RepID=UPI003741FF97
MHMRTERDRKRNNISDPGQLYLAHVVESEYRPSTTRGARLRRGPRSDTDLQRRAQSPFYDSIIRETLCVRPINKFRNNHHSIEDDWLLSSNRPLHPVYYYASTAPRMSSTQSVIVVGAGPVGLLVGLRLAKANIRTIILEALPVVENSPRAAVYHPVAVQELDRAGILQDCRKIGMASGQLTWRHISGEPIFEMGREVSTDELYENLILGQHELAGVILDHFKRCEAGEVLFQHRVVGIEQEEDGDVVTATVETPEGVKKFTASYLIGADGGRSAVRQFCNVTFDGFTWPQQIVATNVVYPFDKYGYSTGNNICHKDHYAVIAKISKSGLWRVSYGEVGGLSTEELRERLPMKYDALMPGPRPLEYDLKMFSPYKIHQRCANTFRIGRVLLAGDAAHLCNPFGGLGLTGGLLDAGALGDTLIARINNNYPDSILDKYSQVRRDIFLKLVDPTSQANLRRLFDSDPDTLRETDPFFKSLLDADGKQKEKSRGLGMLRVEIV